MDWSTSCIVTFTISLDNFPSQGRKTHICFLVCLEHPVHHHVYWKLCERHKLTQDSELSIVSVDLSYLSSCCDVHRHQYFIVLAVLCVCVSVTDVIHLPLISVVLSVGVL